MYCLGGVLEGSNTGIFTIVERESTVNEEEGNTDNGVSITRNKRTECIE